MAYLLSISGKFQNLNQCPMTERPAIATRNFPSVSPAPPIFPHSPFPCHSPLKKNHYISPEKKAQRRSATFRENSSPKWKAREVTSLAPSIRVSDTWTHPSWGRG